MRWLIRIGILVTVLLAAGWLGMRLLVLAPPAPMPATVRIPGLHQPVEVLRDRWGIPHVFAANEEDAYAALGWAVAEDRLFQLFLFKLISQGRLSEITGLWGPVIQRDRLVRTFDFHGQGAAMLERSSAPVKSLFAAYYRGVNASLSRQRAHLPPGVRVLKWLGLKVEPFRSDDLVGMNGVMAMFLNVSWTGDLTYARIASRLGARRADDLFPSARGAEPAVFPGNWRNPRDGKNNRTSSARPAAGDDLLKRLAAIWAPLGKPAASNNWAIAPSHSATGHALLANDPHLMFSLPNTWYLAHLHYPGGDLAGATFPGLPFVIIGRNAHIAWGMTNWTADTADFFIERLRAGDPERVLHDGTWTAIRTRTMTLKGKFQDRRFVVRETPDGPIVTDLLKDAARTLVPAGEAIAYRWAALDNPAGNELEGFLGIDRARDWQEFRSALRHFSGIAQNFVYADTAGNIGMQVAGAMPRLAGTGMRLRRGYAPEDDWDGLIPFDDLPYLYNPTRGWVASANNATWPPGPHPYISAYFESGTRYERIAALLTARPRISPEDMARMQRDTVVPHALDLRDRLLRAVDRGAGGDPAAQAAARILRTWDGHFAADSAGTTVWNFVLWKLHNVIFDDELGHDLSEAYRESYASSTRLAELVQSGGTAWIDDVGTPRRETLDDDLRAAFAAGVAALSKVAGDDPAGWQWGRIHTLTLSHPLAVIPGLGSLDIGPFPAGGDNLTLQRAGYAPGDWKVTYGATLRMIVDLGSPEGMQVVLPAGESGVPASPHYRDLNRYFQEGRYVPLRTDRPSIRADGGPVVTLVPAAPG